MDDYAYGIEVMRDLKKIMMSIRHSSHDHFKDSNLTGPQGMLIGILMHTEKMKISDLSERLCLTNSTVSGIIDRLEKQDIVERVRSDEDRRVVYVKISDEFRSEAKDRFNEMEKEIGSKISKATEEEKEVILKGLKTLEMVLSRKI